MAMTNQLIDYNPIWIARFELEAALLKPVFSNDLLAIHHIGSTAIPGMLAKPEIDLLIVLKSESNFQSYFHAIESFGYRARPDANFSFGHWYFSKDIGGMRTHKMHLCSIAHPNVTEQIAFRDYLIQHPDQAQKYCRLKLELAASNTNGMLEYLNGKAPFISETLRLAKSGQ